MFTSKVLATFIATLLSVSYSYGQELIADFSPGSNNTNYSDMFSGGEHPLFFADNENGSYLLEYRDGQLAIVDSSLINSAKRPLRKLYSDSEKLWYFNTSVDSRLSADSTFVMGSSIIERDLSGNQTTLDTLTFNSNSMEYFWSFGTSSRVFLSEEIGNRTFVTGQNRIIEYVDGKIELKPHAFSNSDFNSDLDPSYGSSAGSDDLVLFNISGARRDIFWSLPNIVRVDQDSVRIFEKLGRVSKLKGALIVQTDLSIDDPSNCTPALRIFETPTNSYSELVSLPGPSSPECHQYGILPSLSRKSDSLHYYQFPAGAGVDERYFKVDGQSAIEVNRDDLPDQRIESTDFDYGTVILDNWEYGMIYDSLSAGGFRINLARRSVSGGAFEVVFENEIPISNVNPFTQKYLLDIMSDGRYLYFSGATRSNGYELWRLNDGQPERMTNIRNGTGSAFPFLLGIHDNYLYFEARDSANGKKLWRLDLSAEPVSTETDLPNKIEPSIVVYPNPVHGDRAINVQLNVEVERFDLFDSLGRKIRTILPGRGEESLRISTNGLSKGVYFLQASTYSNSVLNYSFVIK